MSVWTSFRDTAVRGVAAYYTGGASEAYFQARDQQRSARDAAGVNTMPVTVTGNQVGPAGTFSGSGGSINDMGPKAGVVVNMGRGVAAAALWYCRKYPMWCASLPSGLGSVLAMVKSGTLPKPKRRRRRGISAGDLQKFRRVAGFLHRWGPMCAGATKPRRAPARRA